MYSKDQKKKDIETFIRFDHSCADTVAELGLIQIQFDYPIHPGAHPAGTSPNLGPNGRLGKSEFGRDNHIRDAANRGPVNTTLLDC